MASKLSELQAQVATHAHFELHAAADDHLVEQVGEAIFHANHGFPAECHNFCGVADQKRDVVAAVVTGVEPEIDADAGDIDEHFYELAERIGFSAADVERFARFGRIQNLDGGACNVSHIDDVTAYVKASRIDDRLGSVILYLDQLVGDGGNHEAAAVMGPRKVERACEHDMEAVRVAELVAENFHARFGCGVRRERVGRVGFLVQVSQLLFRAAVDFATAEEQHFCFRYDLAHGFEERLRAKQVDVERFVRLLVAESHGRLASQVIDVRRGNFLNHFLDVSEIQQVARQVLDAFDFLPGLRKFVTETVEFVISTSQV